MGLLWSRARECSGPPRGQRLDLLPQFGQMTNGRSFGGAKQYGTYTAALGLPELASTIRPNPHC